MNTDQTSLKEKIDGESFVGVDSPSYNYKKFFLMSTFTSILATLSIIISKQSYNALFILLVYLGWVFETMITYNSAKEGKPE